MQLNCIAMDDLSLLLCVFQSFYSLSWNKTCVTSSFFGDSEFLREWPQCTWATLGPPLEVIPPLRVAQNPPTPTPLPSMGKKERRSSWRAALRCPKPLHLPCLKRPHCSQGERGGWALKRATNLARRGRGCRGGGHWELCLKPHRGEEARHRASLYAGSRSSSWSPASV